MFSGVQGGDILSNLVLENKLHQCVFSFFFFRSHSLEIDPKKKKSDVCYTFEMAKRKIKVFTCPLKVRYGDPKRLLSVYVYVHLV